MKKSIGLILGIVVLLAVTLGIVAVQADSVIIPDGDYTIVNNGVYQLSSGYSGVITVSNAVYEVTVTDSVYKTPHEETRIYIAEGRTEALELTIEDLDMSASLSSVIDLRNAGSYDNKLYISGICNLTGENSAPLHVPEGVQLTVDKKESTDNDEYAQLIVVNNGWHSAGIGGDASEETGTINIMGGTIKATGGMYSAGIGGGFEGSGGNITISGGVVEGIGGIQGAGIGGGVGATGGNITITGGTVTAISRFGGAGIGGGTDFEDEVNDGGNITISGGHVRAISGGYGAGIGGGNEGSGGNITINGGYVEASCEVYGDNVGQGAYGAGIGGGSNRNHPHYEDDLDNNGGIITINGGTVIARGGSTAAGIGGGEFGEGGTVVINGGTVEAYGGNNGAGIGGGSNRDGGTLTISGGTVKATGGFNAAGIGGGSNGTGADVTILNTPTVIAIDVEPGWNEYPAKPIGNGGGFQELDMGTLRDGAGNNLSYLLFDTSPAVGVNIRLEGAEDLDGEYLTDEEGLYWIFVPDRSGASYSYIMNKAGYSAVEGSGLFTTSSGISVEMTLDDTKPEISQVTPMVIKAGGNVTVACSDYGIYGSVYLAAKRSTAYTSKAQLEAVYIEKLEAASSVSIESTGLTEGYYQIYLIDSAENVSVPEDIFVDTTEPVAASRDITLSDITYRSIRLTWDEAADNFTDAANLEYIIYKSYTNNLDSVESIETNGTVAVNENITGSTGYTVAGLNDETTYYLNIIVRDQAGNKICYNSVSAKTLKAPSDNVRSRTPAPTAAWKIDIPVTDLIGASGSMKEVKNGPATLIIPSNMLTAEMLGTAQTIQLVIGKADTSGLTAELQAQIGSRPVIELELKLDGRTIAWSNPDAPVTVSIPYVPTAEELKNPENITVWYIDGAGNAVSVPSGRYNPATGKVTFTTAHFSRYAVVYVIKTFNDLYSYDWANKQIEILAAKGIMTGRREKSFEPAAGITRAEYIGALVRTLGVTAKAESNFKDVGKDNVYYAEIAIAKKLGITNGTGNNSFKPEDIISRQDMLVLTERALRNLKKISSTGTSKDLEKFADAREVAGYAVESIAGLVMEGLVQGSSGKLNVGAGTTRAEAAVFLYRIYNIINYTEFLDN